MKLLYYNWDLIDGHNGGGVTVYQKNLLTELVKTGKDQIYYKKSIECTKHLKHNGNYIELPPKRTADMPL